MLSVKVSFLLKCKLHLPRLIKHKLIKSKLIQELLGFACITHFHDNYWSQILIIVDKGFDSRILFIFKNILPSLVQTFLKS